MMAAPSQSTAPAFEAPGAATSDVLVIGAGPVGLVTGLVADLRRQLVAAHTAAAGEGSGRSFVPA